MVVVRGTVIETRFLPPRPAAPNGRYFSSELFFGLAFRLGVRTCQAMGQAACRGIPVPALNSRGLGIACSVADGSARPPVPRETRWLS